MSIVLNSLIPIFGLMGLGAISKKFDVLGDNSEKVISRYVLYFALPAMLFVAVAESSMKDLLNRGFLISMILVILFFYLVVFVICLFYRKNIQISSMHSLGISFPNTAFMGIPILLSLFGEEALLPLAIVNLLTTLIFCGTVFILEVTDKDHSRIEKNIYSKVLKVMFTQPVLIGILAGILFSAFRITVPKPVSNFCHQLGMTAGPCAMFILGERILNIKFSSMFKKHITFGLIAKLIIMPIVTVVPLLLLNVNPLWAACGLILMSLPSAGSTYMLAVEKNVCIIESSELIIVSTVLSLVSLPVIILAIPYIWPTVQFAVS